MTPPSVLAGERYGRLVVVREDGRKWQARTYLCRCDCGNETVVIGNNLRKGNTGSCGCLMREKASARIAARNATHGHSPRGASSPTYNTWKSMLQRCNNPHHDAYERYGGRGVVVCDNWLTFENFLADMGDRPAGRTLDRIDNDSGYEKANCRWATYKEQRANRRA